jgi:hypothetical protein
LQCGQEHQGFSLKYSFVPYQHFSLVLHVRKVTLDVSKILNDLVGYIHKGPSEQLLSIPKVIIFSVTITVHWAIEVVQRCCWVTQILLKTIQNWGSTFHMALCCYVWSRSILFQVQFLWMDVCCFSFSFMLVTWKKSHGFVQHFLEVFFSVFAVLN